jgi:ADP-L-glycero-D-manno-heptose 6-epimerase
MIVITGASGFIGSALVWKLNESGTDDLVLSGRLGDGRKWENLRGKSFRDWIDKDQLYEWLGENGDTVETIVHLGACTDTTEEDADYVMETNYEYSKRLWEISCEYDIEFVYASSGATYGTGSHGFSDDVSETTDLKPLNPYGWSKHRFDRWALQRDETPPQWAGLKFFNVYGPNEYHKGEMSSVIYKAFNQATDRGTIELFKSHRDDYEHGQQKRDFIYVKDITRVLAFFVDSDVTGIYNVGTGTARSFDALAEAVIESVPENASVEYIDMPAYLRDQYQYFTEANIDKLRSAGYSNEFYTLEEGITDYVENHLLTDAPHL